MNDGMTFEKCLENLKFTRDFDLYLDMLNALKDKYLIILCVKETTGEYISETSASKIRSLGFSNFSTAHRMRYLGVSDRGKIVCNRASGKANEPAHYKGTLESANLEVVSAEDAAEITLNSTNWSLNERGLNFAVYDHGTSEVIDVTCCDGCEEYLPFFHRNLFFSEQYIDSHIYMPERHMDNVTLYMKKSYFSNRELKVREIERGIFLPGKQVPDDNYKMYGGICDESFNFIAGFQVLDPNRSIRANDRHIHGSYEVPPEEISYIDETVVYSGSMMQHPGHLIIEAFAARIWWLIKNTDSSLKIAVQIIWSNLIGDIEYGAFTKQFFEAFGIFKDRLIFIYKPTKFKKIIIPDQSLIPLCFDWPYEFTAEFAQVFQHIKNQLTPGKNKKIYLTKTQTFRKNVVGEEYFIEFFKAKGFRIVVPEEYTVKEKAEMMYGADEVVTLDGTNALYTVFCKPTARVTVLSRLPGYLCRDMPLIVEAMGLKNIYAVNVSGNFFDRIFSTSLALMCVTDEFKRYVKDIYGEELNVTLEESLSKHLFEYLSYSAEYYAEPAYFNNIKNVKIWDILQHISEILLDKDFDKGRLVLNDNETMLARELERQKEENRLNLEKLRVVADKAKEYIDENVGLKQAVIQLEAENEELRRKNSELSSFMAEINQLLGELDSNNGQLPENLST